jgi:hypothetical protein
MEPIAGPSRRRRMASCPECDADIEVDVLVFEVLLVVVEIVLVVVEVLVLEIVIIAPR